MRAVEQFILLSREVRRTHNNATDLIIEMIVDLHERLKMTDQNVADLKRDYETFRDTMNAKVQALMDAQAGVTLPPEVQQAINDLAAEITGDTANAAAGSAAAVSTEPAPPVVEAPLL